MSVDDDDGCNGERIESEGCTALLEREDAFLYRMNERVPTRVCLMIERYGIQPKDRSNQE